MTDALLSAADAAQRSFWLGSDRTKINLREAMTTLRLAVEDEKRKLSKDETARLTNKDRDHA